MREASPTRSSELSAALRASELPSPAPRKESRHPLPLGMAAAFLWARRRPRTTDEGARRGGCIACADVRTDAGMRARGQQGRSGRRAGPCRECNPGRRGRGLVGVRHPKPSSWALCPGPINASADRHAIDRPASSDTTACLGPRDKPEDDGEGAARARCPASVCLQSLHS